MISMVYAICSKGVEFKQLLSSSAKDANQEVKELQSFYKEAKITKKLIGFQVMVAGAYNRNILFKDLNLVTESEIKTIKNGMIQSLLTKDFSNDNTTFFMLTRGLINEQRTELSEKGQEIYNAYWN